MSDLVSMQSNIKIDLFMVAPDQRWEKVSYEIHRPTFPSPIAAPAQDLPPPLPSCGGGWSRSGVAIRYMKPEFTQIAESCEPDYS